MLFYTRLHQTCQVGNFVQVADQDRSVGPTYRVVNYYYSMVAPSSLRLADLSATSHSTKTTVSIITSIITPKLLTTGMISLATEQLWHRPRWEH